MACRFESGLANVYLYILIRVMPSHVIRGWAGFERLVVKRFIILASQMPCYAKFTLYGREGR